MTTPQKRQIEIDRLNERFGILLRSEGFAPEDSSNSYIWFDGETCCIDGHYNLSEIEAMGRAARKLREEMER